MSGAAASKPARAAAAAAVAAAADAASLPGYHPHGDGRALIVSRRRRAAGASLTATVALTDAALAMPGIATALTLHHLRRRLWSALTELPGVVYSSPTATAPYAYSGAPARACREDDAAAAILVSRRPPRRRHPHPSLARSCDVGTLPTSRSEGAACESAPTNSARLFG